MNEIEVNTSEEIDRMKFINYFQTFTSYNCSKYDEILVHLHNYAIKYGLNEDDMTLVAEVSFKQNLGFMRIRKLLTCLIPRKFCSNIAVKTVIFQLNKYRDGSKLILKHILQWLIGVIEFNLVQTNDAINTYYHLYVYFMRFEIIDVPAAKLVYFLTKPDDVTRHLTNQIINLYKTTSNGRHFAALLYLFKCYRPDVVPENIPIYSTQKSFGKYSKGIMESLICAKTRIQGTLENSLYVDNVWNKFGIENITGKKLKEISLLPDTHIPFDDFVLSSTNETKCVLSLLNNSIGMHMIKFGQKITQERLSYQIYFILYDAFLDRNPNVSYAERNKILEKIASLQNYLEHPIPVVSKFIGQYLMRWDGFEHQKPIFNIIEWMYVKSFTELRQCVLTYLLYIFKTNNVATKCRILNCLGNFTVNIITTYEHRESRRTTSKHFDVNDQLSNLDYIKQLFLFLENLFLLGIIMERKNPAILNTIVIINEHILTAGKRAGINFKICRVIPYTALFHPLPNALNVVCRLINEFPACVSQSVKQDFIDCLLKQTAFTSNKNKGSIFNGFKRNDELKIRDIEKRLHVKHHYAFISYTFLINNKTSEDKSEELLNQLKKKFLDIFRFLKNHV